MRHCKKLYNIYFIYLGIFICCLLVFIFVLFLRPKYKKFNQHVLYGVLWKWKWYKKNVANLKAYCKECGCEIYYDDEIARIHNTNLNEKYTFFICNNCEDKQKGKILGGDKKYAHKIVRREILKLVKTNKYKEILNEQRTIRTSS